MMTKIRAALTTKWAIMAISALVAIVLWYYGYMNANPVETRSYQLREIRLRNVSKLEETDRFLANQATLSSQTVTVKIRTSRKAHVQIEKDREAGLFYAYIDFSLSQLIYATGVVNTEVSYYLPSRYETDENLEFEKVSVSPSSVSANFDLIEEKTFSVKAQMTENLSEDPNFSATPFACWPDKVTVRGPSVELNKIASLTALIDPPAIDVTAKGAPNEYSATVKPRLYDRNGAAIISENLKFIGVSDVAVSYNVVKTKEIPVVAPEITGAPAEGYALNPNNPLYDFEPKTVEIKGFKEDVDEIVNIKINPVDVTGMTSENPTAGDNLRVYLSEINPRLDFVNPNLIDVRITARIERLVEREFAFDMSAVKITGEEGEFLRLPVNLTEIIRIRAVESLIERVDDISGIVSAKADITILGSVHAPGDYEVPVSFESKEGFEIISAPEYITVTVSAPSPVIPEEPGDNGESPSGTPEPGAAEQPSATEEPSGGDGQGAETPEATPTPAEEPSGGEDMVTGGDPSGDESDESGEGGGGGGEDDSGG